MLSIKKTDVVPLINREGLAPFGFPPLPLPLPELPLLPSREAFL